MATDPAIPQGAAIAINDLLQHCAEIQRDQDVLILAHLEGLYGGDNLTALDHPAVLAVAAKYPGRPGPGPVPKSY